MDQQITPNWQERYNAAHIIRLRVRVLDRPGALVGVLDAIGRSRAPLGDITNAGLTSSHRVRDIQVFFTDREHMERTIAAVRATPDCELLDVKDEVLEIHRGGAIEIRHRVPLDTLMDLRMVYTPGVASVCERIRDEPETAWDFTAIGRRVAIVTNGTAVLGLGDIGPLASLPVMEGKAAILSKFVGVSGDPVLVDSKDPDEIIRIVERIAGSYGLIQLEDIAAPECFQIEDELQRRLPVPVFHDDQHGTATVVIAGLISALKRIGRAPADCRAVLLGAGAAGIAIARFLLDFGVGDVVLCDSRGAIHKGREEGMNAQKRELAEITNKDNVTGDLAAAMKGRNLFVGVSRPNMVSKDMVATMGKDAVVFALANPVSEIRAADALQAGAAIAVDGRGMNNALAFPGIFRGALDARARRVTAEMKLAAAHALADAAPSAPGNESDLLPDMLDMTVHQRVAEAVRNAWRPD